MNLDAEPVLIAEADLSDHSHAEAIRVLLNEYATGINGGGCPLESKTLDRLIPELAKRCNRCVFLAFVGNEPVGLLIAFEGFSTFAAKPLLNIHDLMVTAKFRGRGISKLLIARAEDVARERACCKLTLEVLEGNKLAIQLYKKVGFKNYELDPAMGKALFMEKKL